MNTKNLWLNTAQVCLGLFLLLTAGCTRHVVETRSQVELAPVELKPIHITIDVNIKVDRALDSFFADLDEEREEIHRHQGSIQSRAASPGKSNP